MKETNLLLNDHADRKGADICGKAHALDIAILDSINNSTRAGGMATSGDADDPHLICITGDGAGLTGRDSGVRVAHFPGQRRTRASGRPARSNRCTARCAAARCSLAPHDARCSLVVAWLYVLTRPTLGRGWRIRASHLQPICGEKVIVFQYCLKDQSGQE